MSALSFEVSKNLRPMTKLIDNKNNEYHKKRILEVGNA